MATSHWLQRHDRGPGRNGRGQRPNRHPQAVARPRHFVPRFEALEDRTLLSVFSVVNLDDAGPGSLREAVLATNQQPDADVIQFASELTGTITLGSPLGVTNDLAIEGPGAGRLTLSGGGTTRVFDISGSETDVSIHQLTIADAMATEITVVGPSGPVTLGGGILNTGARLTLTHVALVNNQVVAPAPGVQAGGGAIASIYGATLSVQNCSLAGNRAVGHSSGTGDSWGGAIVNDAGSTLTVTHSEFLGNQALEGGYYGSFAGAIVTGSGCHAEVSHSSFAGNVALGRHGTDARPATGGRGGAIANVNFVLLGSGENSTLIVDQSTFTANQAIGGNGADADPNKNGGSGGKAIAGAIVTSGKGSATIVSSCVFTENQALGGHGGGGGQGWVGGYGASASAGALDATSAALTVVDSTFVRNEAIGGNGGCGGYAGLEGGNGTGGAISSSLLTMTPDDIPTLDVRGATFTGNRAVGGNGGDGHYGQYSNGGIGQGGAISASFGTMNLAKSSFTANQAIGGNGGLGEKKNVGGIGGMAVGGAIACCYDAPSIAFVAQCTFEGNTAFGGAGGLWARGGDSKGGGIGSRFGTLTVNDSYFVGNEAIGGTGGEGGGGGEGAGGGIFNAGTATLTGTIITGNKAVGGAAGSGGLPGLGVGGGVYNSIALGATISIDAVELIFGNDADLYDDCFGCD